MATAAITHPSPGKILLDVVTPESKVLSVEVDSVRAPGAEGQFGVLPGHTPFLAAMEPGELVLTAAGRDTRYFVGGGFVDVSENHVIVLAESAEPAEGIDLERAKRALGESQERLKTLQAESEQAAVERARVKRAAARIAVAGRR